MRPLWGHTSEDPWGSRPLGGSFFVSQKWVVGVLSCLPQRVPTPSKITNLLKSPRGTFIPLPASLIPCPLRDFYVKCPHVAS